MSEWTGTLVRVLIDSSLRSVFVGTAIVLMLSAFRIRSSTVRHAAWTAVLAAMMLMPVLPRGIPAIHLPVTVPSNPISRPVPDAPEPEVIPEAPSVETSLLVAQPVTSSHRLPDWQDLAIVVYLFGIALLSVRLLSGWRAMRRLISTARRIEGMGAFPVLESTFISSAMTAGIAAPRILLPAEWTSWPQEKLQAILAHETAHIGRRDPLVAFIARVNCALFWFHPMAWWLQRQLSVTAEHACDDAAVQAAGTPRHYAEILIGIAESVRRNGGRVSPHSIGVNGNGLLGHRIDRILKGDSLHKTTTARKVAFAVTCGAAIFVAAACRQQSISFSADIQLEEQRAAAREASKAARLRSEFGKRTVRERLARAAADMTEEQVAELESLLVRTPHDIETREKLLYFYSRDEKMIAERRRHILWLIDQHPDAELLGSAVARISPHPSDRFSDPEGYAEAVKLWTARTGPTNFNVNVLSNAAYFVEAFDKPLAERWLLRAQALMPDDSWSRRLGRVYALALLGADPIIFGETLNGNLSNFAIRAVNAAEYRNAFADAVRQKLTASRDAQLLSEAGALLIRPYNDLRFDFDPLKLGASYLERARQLNPDLVLPHQILLRIRGAERTEPLREALRKVEKDAKYQAISAMPAGQRFLILREMAEYSYHEASSLEVIDPEQSAKIREQARRYAEDLLKLAPEFRGDPAYSGAVFTAYIVSGHIAARNGDSATAVKYLRDASSTPASEEMAYLLPNAPYQQFCTLLIGSGYRDDVVAFFDHIAGINVSEHDSLLRMAANVRAGKNLL